MHVDFVRLVMWLASVCVGQSEAHFRRVIDWPNHSYPAVSSGSLRQNGPRRDGGTTSDLTQTQHIVFIIMEDRSFDEYCGTFPGADSGYRRETDSDVFA